MPFSYSLGSGRVSSSRVLVSHGPQAPRAALLARDRVRSDDLEAGDGPDPVRPPAEPPIHPFTGKFADPEHTVAYRSQAFRMMMPLALFAHRRDGTHDTGGDRGVLLVIAN